MLMPCGYLERTRLIRLLRQLEISTCSRAGARADLRDRSRAMFPRDIDRGYNHVCRNGPRSRPSQPIAETFVQLPKTGNIAKAVPVKFVVSKNSIFFNSVRTPVPFKKVRRPPPAVHRQLGPYGSLPCRLGILILRTAHCNVKKN